MQEPDSLANWMGAIDQCVGALATLAAVWVALYLPGRERRRGGLEERHRQLERQLEAASLVIISVTGEKRNPIFLRIRN